ncbi:MAG: hypothetical protein WA996_05505 [Candidatus Promineifilaceae bacterium]
MLNDSTNEENGGELKKGRLVLISGAVFFATGALVAVGIKSRDKIEQAANRGRELLANRSRKESAEETVISDATEEQEAEVSSQEEETQ